MFKKILLSIFFIILLFNKIILSQIILISLEKWLGRDIKIKNLDISYKNGSLTFEDFKIFEKNQLEKNVIFSSEKVFVNFRLSSFLTTLIMIEKINIFNATLFINFQISEKNKITNDNIGVLRNIKNKNPKIYPKKMIDINFLVNSSKLINSKVVIKTKDKEIIKINLSEMYFELYGNEKNYLHYKDVIKIILTDTILRIPDQELKNLIKETYKIK